MPGTITFRPVEANLTHDTDWLGKMDPYCIFTIGTQRAKSDVCKHGGTRPHWESTVSLQTLGTPSVCRVDVMDKDRFRPDDSIAATEIDLTEIERLGRVSKWYPVYHHRKLAGEILIEAAFQSSQPIIQNVIPVQQTFVQEEIITTSVPLVSNTEFSQIRVGQEQLLGQPMIGQSYEIPTTGMTTETFIQGTEYTGLPINQGFNQFPQGQFIQGGNPIVYGESNIGPIQDTNMGLLASKTSALGPQGGLPHGHHQLKGATNIGYAGRPGYTIGNVEADPTNQTNLDSNGGGHFLKHSRERTAEPYTLSNPGTYGIPHGQTIDTAGHLHPEAQLTGPAPIGQINQPGYTGYPQTMNNNLGAQNLNQGGL